MTSNDRRTVLQTIGATALKAFGATAVAAALPRAFAGLQGWFEPVDEGIGSIDDLLEGGTQARRNLLAKLSDDQKLTRHIANLYSLPSDQDPEERKKVTWTLRELARITNANEPEAYSRGESYEIPLDEAIAATRPHLANYAQLARSVAWDDRFLAAKIARESNANPLEENLGALGLTQIEKPTYANHVDWAALAGASNRAVLPTQLHDEFMSGGRPLRDSLLFTPDLARKMGLRLEERSIGATQEEYLDRWLPFGLLVDKQHGGTFPTKGGVNESLYDAETNLKAGGLIAFSYLLRLNHVLKQRSLPFDGYDPAQTLAAPRLALAPDVVVAAFNRGDGGAQSRLLESISKLGSSYSVELLADTYDQIDPGTRSYRHDVLSSTGAMQALTRNSLAEYEA